MFNKEGWYQYLDEPMRELVDLAYLLKDREEIDKERLYDYSFLLFPMAKAYEGFLKKFLWRIELISKETMMDRTFRIGRSLNPDLPEKYRNGLWLFDQLEIRCERFHTKLGGCGARKAWEAWVEGRNQVFHYFSGKEGPLSFEEATRRMEQMRVVMEMLVDNEEKLKG